MSDKTDEEERDAKKAVGEKLNEIYDEAEEIKGDDLSDDVKATDKDGSDKFKEKLDKATAESASEDILDEIDELKEELSRAEYKKANKRRRKLAKKVKAKLKTGAGTKGKNILDALKEIRKKKLKDLWTPAPVASKKVSMGGDDFFEQEDEKKFVSAPALAEEIALRASLDAEFETLGVDAIPFLPLSAVSGISESDADILREALGVNRIRDLAHHPILQRLLYLNTVC